MMKFAIALAVCACAVYATPMDTDNGGTSLEQNIANWIERQELSVELPFIGSKVTLDARNLEDDEVDMKVQLSTQPEARKSKLKKIFAPILIVVILKAITLIPLALGLLGLKTWNAIQLSFVTFVVSIGLAVFEMCKKIAADHVHPVVSHSAPWPAARAMMSGDMAQPLAYSAYTD